MGIIDLLDNYIVSQKWIGTNLIIFGVLFLLLCLAFVFFVTKTPFTSSIKCATAIISITLIVTGYALIDYTNDAYNTALTLYEENPLQFIAVELQRLEFVDRQYVYIQVVYVAIIAISLLVLLLSDSERLNGVAISVAILFIGVMFIESFTRSSVKAYIAELLVGI